MQDILAAEGAYSWLFYLGTVLLFAFIVEVGFRVGRRLKRRVDPEQKSQAGTVLAALLALLGFLLAISFGIAADRFAERKALVLEEANAISTAFLRTSFLPEPHRAQTRDLLRDYTVERVRPLEGWDPQELEQVLSHAEDSHRELWAQADEVAAQHPRSVPVGLFIDSLNEVIDLHEERVTVGLRYRIPPSLLWTLYLVSILSMLTLGLHFGLSGTRSVVSTVALVVAFSAVLLLIIDLDAPQQRLFVIGQDPLVDTQQLMEHTLEEKPPSSD